MIAEQTLQKDTIVFGLDNIVIRKCIADIQGGRTLNCGSLGVAKDILKAGHVIIKLVGGDYAPMPIIPGREASPAKYKVTADSSKQNGKIYYTKDGDTYNDANGAWVEGVTYYEKESDAVTARAEGYGSLPGGASYVGILKDSILVKNPQAAILTAGVVNPEVVPYPMTSIMADFKAAVPTIIFEKDEEA